MSEEADKLREDAKTWVRVAYDISRPISKGITLVLAELKRLRADQLEQAEKAMEIMETLRR